MTLQRPHGFGERQPPGFDFGDKVDAPGAAQAHGVAERFSADREHVADLRVGKRRPERHEVGMASTPVRSRDVSSAEQSASTGRHPVKLAGVVGGDHGGAEVVDGVGDGSELLARERSRQASKPP